MNLLMTGRMEQYSVFCAVWSPLGSPQDVMAMPSRDPGDLLVTDSTKAILLLPEVAEPPPPFEPGFHLHVEAFFKLRFPGRIVGISLCADLRVPLNADRRSRQQSDHFHLALFSFEDTCEDPTVWSFIGAVFVFHPSARFVLMSSACPFPDRLEDGMIHGMKNRFTDHMAMIEYPSTDLWIEFCNQLACGQVTTFFDTFSDLAEKCLHALL